MSINQLLIDTVKPLDIVVDTINGLKISQLRGETYTTLVADNVPFQIVDTNINTLSASQNLIVGFNSLTTAFGDSTEYNAVSFQGNLGLNTSVTTTGTILKIGINASNFPNFPTDMVLMGFSGLIQTDSDSPPILGYISDVSQDLQVSFTFPAQILNATDFHLFFECKFRYANPV
jgi:hypothetical protein